MKHIFLWKLPKANQLGSVKRLLNSVIIKLRIIKNPPRSGGKDLFSGYRQLIRKAGGPPNRWE